MHCDRRWRNYRAAASTASLTRSYETEMRATLRQAERSQLHTATTNASKTVQYNRP